MSSAKGRLAGNSDRVGRPAAECWRVEQIGPASPRAVDTGAKPLRSRALSLWLDRLRDRPGSATYRICPASDAG